MNKRLVQLLQSGKIGGGEIYLLDAYNQTVPADIVCAITTRINESNHYFIYIKEKMKITPLNTDIEGNCSCIKANYYKMGGANFLGHTKDGFKATCIMEVNEPIGCAMRGRKPENPSERGQGNGKYIQRIEMGSNISNTITSVQKDSLVAEPNEDTATTLCLNSKVDGKQPSLEHCAYDSEGISTAVTTGFHPSIQESTSYRIRKLTPRECFRLMGVSESDIDKIQNSGVSQSQQYKMAGNSIVVDVIEHIFRKMFVDTGQESQQLSLF